MSGFPKICALAAAVALAGCATDYDLENRMPDARYVSARAVPVVAQCIAAGLNSRGRAEVETGQTSTYITLRAMDGHPAARIRVFQTATGSAVLVRQTISYNLGTAIQRCL